MQENSLDRVREDLATIRAALEKELPFGPADVRLYVTIAATSGFFAICHAMGADRGWPLFLAGLPAILAFMTFLGYMAAKGRRGSSVEVSRRREYRKTLLIIVPVMLAALAGKYWADYAGMSHLQFGGVLLVVMGCTYTIIAMTGPWSAGYPRSYWLFGGLPLIVAGCWLPFVTHWQAFFVIGCMMLACFGLPAIVMHYHLDRQDRRASDAAD